MDFEQGLNDGEKWFSNLEKYKSFWGKNKLSEFKEQKEVRND